MNRRGGGWLLLQLTPINIFLKYDLLFPETEIAAEKYWLSCSDVMPVIPPNTLS